MPRAIASGAALFAAPHKQSLAALAAAFAAPFQRAGRQLAGGSLAHITLAYLALPLLIWLFGWLKLIYAVPLSVLLLYLLASFFGAEGSFFGAEGSFFGAEGSRGGESKAEVRPGAKAVLLCAIVALLWTFISGAGLGGQTDDWHKHNGMLKALLAFDWPVLLGDGPRLDDRALVFTFGYYLPAVAFGKIFYSWYATLLALYLWTAAGVCLTLLWFVHLARGRAAILAPLFVVLGGMTSVHNFLVPINPNAPWWDQGGWSPMWLHLSEMTTLLFWVPQHALSGWLGAALFWQLREEPGFHRNCILLGVCVCVWSFFTALGLAALVLLWFTLHPRTIRGAVASFGPLAILRQAGRHAGALLLAAPLLLFLAASTFRFPWEFHALFISENGLWLGYFIFVASEFGFLGLVAWVLGPRGQRGLVAGLCLVAMAFLLYKVGEWHDTGMRSTIPALFLLWCLALRAFIENRGRDLRTRALKGLLAAAIVIGLVRPGVEFYNTFRDFRAAPITFTEAKTYGEEHQFYGGQYIGYRQSFFFRHLAPQESPQSWPPWEDEQTEETEQP